MRGTVVVKGLATLFVAGLIVAFTFALVARVQWATAGPSKAVVSLAFHKMSVGGQVKDRRAKSQTIRRQRAEVLDEYHTGFAERGIPFALGDNFGAMIGVLGGLSE